MSAFRFLVRQMFNESFKHSVSNHASAFFQINLVNTRNIDHIKCELNFDTADYVTINSQLEKTEWEAAFNEYSLDTIVNKCYSLLNDTIPPKGVFSGSYTPWHGLISHIVSKKQIHKKWLTIFLRSFISRLICNNCNIFFLKMLWSFVRSLDRIIGAG